MKEIKLSSGKIVKMRPPKVRDMRAVSDLQNEQEQEIQLISHLTGLTMEELDDLEWSEYKKLQEALKDFLS